MLGLAASLERRLPLLPGYAASYAILAAVALTLALGTSGAWEEVDQSDNYEGRRLIEAVAQNVPPEATVLAGRATTTLQYMRHAENSRENAEIETVTVTAENVDRRAESALNRGPTYLARPELTDASVLEESGYKLIPVEQGLLYEVRPRR